MSDFYLFGRVNPTNPFPRPHETKLAVPGAGGPDRGLCSFCGQVIFKGVWKARISGISFRCANCDTPLFSDGG